MDGERVRALCGECGAHVLGIQPGTSVAQSGDDEDEYAMSPYRRIAAGLRDQISSGVLMPGQQLPMVKDLAVTNGVAVGTAQRALALLAEEGLVSLNRSIRTTVRAPEA